MSNTTYTFKSVTLATLLAAVTFIGFAHPSVAQTSGQSHTSWTSPDDKPFDREGEEPMALDDLQNMTSEDGAENEEMLEFSTKNLRLEAMREAALSFGARGGLAWQTREINKSLEQQGTYMDRVYDFKRLLVTAPSGLLIEPPVVDESIDAMLIQSDGQQAAVSDRILNINKNAKIVSTARNWRTYLERQWGSVTPPPSVLLPVTREERKEWSKIVSDGWQEGVNQANEIFQADLNRLNRDFTGMVRYRMLLAQGMISAPYAMQVDRGVTGGGNEMRVGDRAVKITGPSQLNTEALQWNPARR